MLELKKGVDILTEVGGVRSISDARALFDSALDTATRAKLASIRNEEALLRIAKRGFHVRAGQSVRRGQARPTMLPRAGR